MGGSNRPILIQGAMTLEIDWLCAHLTEKKLVRHGAWPFWRGTLFSYPVVISQTGMGLTNVTAATTLALTHFRPLVVINQGTAGGHAPDIHVGDLVIGTKAVNIGTYQSPYRAEGAGLRPLDWEAFGEVSVFPENLGENSVLNEFPSDPEWLRYFTEAKDEYREGSVHLGVIGSADMWNREVDRINWLRERYHTAIEEMEGAAVGQVAAAFSTPFIGVRVVTNSDITGEEYRPEVANDSQKFVAQVISRYVERLNQGTQGVD